MIVKKAYYTKYCIENHCGSFSNDIFYEQVYKYCHPNLVLIHPLLVLCIMHLDIFVMNFVMDG